MTRLQPTFKIGQPVHIEIANEQGMTTRYPSCIENLDAGTLTLAGPIKNREPLFLPAGSEVNVWYWDSFAIYTFRAAVVRSIGEDIPLLILNKPKSVERVQKREFVRVQCNLSVILRYFNTAGKEQELICWTRDISAGGMMLILTKSVDLNNEAGVSLRFELNEENFEVKGKIVWNDWELDTEGIERNILGVQFTGLSEDNRQKIIKYVFKRQIEHRRKGLL